MSIRIFYESPIVLNDTVICEWNNDTDFDDYLDCKFGNIHYKLINDLLILINIYKYDKLITILTNPKISDDNIKLLRNYYEECLNVDKDISECLIIHFQNIMKLYQKIKTIPVFTDFILTHIKPTSITNAIETIKYKDLYLYRGFNIYSDKVFNVIEKNKRGDIITSPIFLATSVVKEVAMRFMSSSAEIPLEKKVMWKIIIPNNLLNIFNYVYFGSYINLDIKPSNGEYKEHEVLINIGAKLKFISRDIERGTYKYNGKYYENEYMLFTYEFVGWSNTFIKNITEKISFFIKSLSNTLESDAIEPVDEPLSDGPKITKRKLSVMKLRTRK
jgi:hypothetical protein